jgi:GAF domain-containing protein
VIGVLDVQSRASAAFEPSDVEVLQILADQIALAIENTRLLEQSQEAIEELQHAYGAQTKSGWTRWLKIQAGAYYFDRIRVSPIPIEQIKQIRVFSINNPTIQNTHDGSSIILPITLRNQKLGTIVLRRDLDQPQWNSEDLNIVRESVAQIALALDNARLLDETRRHAEHEQTVSEISSKFSRSFDVESILRTAVRELGQLPNVTDASVHIRAPKTD